MLRTIFKIFNNYSQKSMIYEVRACGATWALRKDTILRYVPGVLEYSSKRSRFSPRIMFDIGGVIDGNAFVGNGDISSEQLAHRLEELMDSIEETEADSQLVQTPLLLVLENSWRRRQRDASRVLVDFVCLADIVSKANLGGSPALKAELSTFFAKHSEHICRSLPLSMSLQFVDMCPSSDFPVSMEHLLANLPSSLRHALEERDGKVPPYFSSKPSDKIKRYIRQRGWGRTAAPGNPMMAPHHRIARAISPRGRRRLLDFPNNTIGPVARSISAERLLEQDVDLHDVAMHGGRIILPARGRRSPSQGPSTHHRRFGHRDGWLGG
jgi:hypothetical protein